MSSLCASVCGKVTCRSMNIRDLPSSITESYGCMDIVTGILLGPQCAKQRRSEWMPKAELRVRESQISNLQPNAIKIDN